VVSASAFDAAAFITIPAVLVLVALLACLSPALRHHDVRRPVSGGLRPFEDSPPNI
jgi:hypothetical protein